MNMDKINLLYDKLLNQQNEYEQSNGKDKIYNILEEKLYCLTEYAEVGYDWYKKVAEYIKQKGYKHVYDIGCCYGFQSEFFTDLGITYTGIEISKYMEPYLHNKEKASYILKQYPFDIKTTKTDIAISHLCVGFLIRGNENYKQISEQFDSIIIDNKGIERYYNKQEVLTNPKNEKIYIFRKE